MDRYSTITISVKGTSATISLNRPEAHNAMDIGMIRELSKAFRQLSDNPDIRVIVLNSNGRNFSSGADLQWMQEGLGQDRDQLEAESRELATLFRIIADSGPVVVASVRGKAIGGAVGLVAASDLAIAERDTVFRFSEVKLGLIPATIAPFVLRKAGTAATAGWFLTGREFTAVAALEAGLIQYVCPEDQLEKETGSLVKELISGGPAALRGIKKLLRKYSVAGDPDEILAETAALIAAYRTSAEGQEGIKAFFEKRKPRWTHE